MDKTKRTTIFRVVLATIIVVLAVVVVYEFTKPQPTPLEALRLAPPRYTFLVQCRVKSLGIFINPHSLKSDRTENQNGREVKIPGGENKEGKYGRKYTLACLIPADSQVISLYPELQPALPIHKPGETHTYTLYEDAVMAMIDLEESQSRFNYPIDSEGVYVIPVDVYDWAKAYPINLVCFEEISTSTDQPEHGCWLH